MGSPWTYRYTSTKTTMGWEDSYSYNTEEAEGQRQRKGFKVDDSF